MKEWTPDSRNTPSTTNPEEEEIVDALGNDGNASMLEQFKRPKSMEEDDDPFRHIRAAFTRTDGQTAI